MVSKREDVAPPAVSSTSGRRSRPARRAVQFARSRQTEPDPGGQALEIGQFLQRGPQVLEKRGIVDQLGDRPVTFADLLEVDARPDQRSRRRREPIRVGV